MPAFLCLSSLSLLALIAAQSPSVVTTVIISNPQPTDDPSYTSDSNFQSAVLNSTNFYRNEHNATSLTWNATLATYASDYVTKCVFQHSNGPYGENLAEGYANATAAIEAWGNEGADYDFSAGDFSESTGHFTQLVWKGTTSVGCGKEFCNGRNGVPGWYVACEYFPRGNVLGYFTENVQACEHGSGDSCSAALRLIPRYWLASSTPVTVIWRTFLVSGAMVLLTL